jgi:peptidoglycan/xylan/chitin deacetylase (PgdA/CDA1 family)
VTFDDAFRSTFDVAFPILQRFKIPATVFIPTAFVDSADCLWFCKVNRAVGATTKDSVTWAGEHYDLSSTTARAAASARIQACLKRYPQRQLLEQLRTLSAALEQEVGTPVARDSPYAVLDVYAIEQMAASGLVEFGAHTHTHAILSLLSPEERAQEIRESVTRVRGLTARTCAIFAYPNGRRQDYDETVVEVLRGVGVRAAVTTVPGLNDRMTPRMELRRTGVGSDTTLDDFEAMVHDGHC